MTAALDGSALTALYLDEIARSGTDPGELTAAAGRSRLLHAIYRGACLPRPLFLGTPECERLQRDLESLRSMLVSLPDRLFSGDLAAFARATGLADAQVAAVLRSVSPEVSALARPDLYRERSGFKVLEVNLGSPVGGAENAEMCRALLSHPLLAAFARQHGLGYVDTLREQVKTIFAETAASPGPDPVVAVTDWPGHYRQLGPYLAELMPLWRTLGLDAHPCHLGELDIHGGRVWLRGRRVDIVYRIFLLEHLLEPEGPGLIGPVLAAAARGEVAMFTPMDTDLYGSKAALAMLSDHANRHLFTPAEQAVLDRIVPWTRLVRPGPVTLPDGSTADLLDYAIAHPADLVIKPAGSHGGQGVVAGWRHTAGSPGWRDALAGAARAPHVIQRRVRPEPELFPCPDGTLVNWIVTWGVFTLGCGYGGVLARAAVADPAVAAISLGGGASAGACLVSGCTDTSAPG